MKSFSGWQVEEETHFEREDKVMKRRIAILGVVLSILFSTGANGEVYEFELPDLAGMSAGSSVTTEFVYTGPSGHVNSLSAKLTGTVDYLGLVECFSEPPDTSEWVLDIGTFLKKPGQTGYWSGSPGFLDQLGPFDETYNHHTYTNGFSTIADGDTVQVEMYFYPASLIGICHPITGPSTGTLQRASILVNVSEPTPATETTWGRMKLLFR